MTGILNIMLLRYTLIFFLPRNVWDHHCNAICNVNIWWCGTEQLSCGKPIFTFYDGPPFATGLPHYGHILAGTIKDTVTRYAHQTGHHVERRFGWDCHGLPVEYEIDQNV